MELSISVNTGHTSDISSSGDRRWGGDRPGGNRIWKHSLYQFPPFSPRYWISSTLAYKHPISDVNKAILLLFIINLIHHCEVCLFLCFVPVQYSGVVWWCAVFYQWQDPFQLLYWFTVLSSYRSVDTALLLPRQLRVNVSTHTTRGHFTSPFYKNLTHFSLASLWNKECRAFFFFFCYFLLVS